MPKPGSPDRLRTRFAPSPTGLLHVGNAYSALCCQAWAEEHRGECLLRIEDIDHTRCREDYVKAMLEDLRWLGFRWAGEPVFQSRRLPRYRQMLERLRQMGLIYPCFCTRREILEELRRIGSAPHHDDIITSYPGTCRRLSEDDRQQRMQAREFAWRLDCARALQRADVELSWMDEHGNRHALLPDQDVIIARRDIGISYHLATVIDDADQGITHIIRGEDLKDSLPIHRLLQVLLELPEPVYIHHRLVRDVEGRRLAKRSGATTLAGLRHLGVSAAALRRFLMQSPDLIWPDVENEPGFLKALLDDATDILGSPA